MLFKRPVINARMKKTKTRITNIVSYNFLAERGAVESGLIRGLSIE